MEFNDLSPNDFESYRLDFLFHKTFDELHEIQEELPLEAKALYLRKLSLLVVEFSTLFFGGK